MRKSKTTIAAILLAVSMMTACAGGQSAVTAIQESASRTAGTEAAAAASSAETSAEIKAETSAAAASAEAAGTGIPADAVTVKLTGTGAEISGAGAEFEDGTLKITKGGTYVLSGRLDGQILLETDKKEEVTLYLNGVEIASEGAYAIASVKGKAVAVILADGTENTLTAKGIADEDNARTEEEEADAAIYVKNDLTMDGTGSLSITSAGKGIHAKDNLVLADGVIDITSADDAFNGKDSITADGGAFTVTVTDTEEGKAMTSRGAVTLNGGTMTVAASNEGIEGLTVTVNGGFWDVTAADDGVNAREKAETTETAETTESTETVESTETAGSTETIGTAETAQTEETTGAADGMNQGNPSEDAPENMPQDGGFDGRGGFDGMPPQGGFGGRDGFDGHGGFGGQGGFGGMTEEEMAAERLKMQYNEKCQIVVNGGTLIVNSQGDGLDSNGDIHINGGEVYVSSAEDSGNTALDWNGTGYVDGGILIAAGMPGMAEAVSDESGQNILTVCYENQIAAGTEISVKDPEGKVIMGWTVPKAFQSLQLSASGLETDKTYTVTAGETENSVTITGTNTYEGERGFGGRGGFGRRGQRGSMTEIHAAD